MREGNVIARIIGLNGFSISWKINLVRMYQHYHISPLDITIEYISVSGVFGNIYKYVICSFNSIHGKVDDVNISCIFSKKYIK